MLVAIFFSIAVAQTVIVEPSKQIPLNKSKFEGFIYPYVITSEQREHNQFELTFTRLDKSQVLFQPQQINQSMLQVNYEMLPQSASLRIENVRHLQLTISQSVIVIDYTNNISRGFHVLMRNPHLYYYFVNTGNTTQLKKFICMFQKTQGKQSNEKNIGDIMLSVEELWREFIYIYLYTQEEIFTLYLERHITYYMNPPYYIEPYRFVKKYYFESDILGMKLIKSSVKDVLYIIIFDKNSFCIFETSKQLDVQFNECVNSINIGTKQNIAAFHYDGLLYQTNNINTTTQQKIQHSQQYHLVMFDINNQQSIINSSNTCRYTQINQISYAGTTGQYAVYCSFYACHLLDQECQPIGQPIKTSQQKKDTLAFVNIQNVQLIRYNITKDQFISQLIIKTIRASYRFVFCMNDEISVEITNSKGNKEFICKTSSNISKISVENNLPVKATSKCDGLNCFKCSMTSHCYFIDGQCKLYIGRLIDIQPQNTYKEENLFEKIYARYLYGQTSLCPADAMHCSISKANIVSSIQVSIFKNPPTADQYCIILVPLTTDEARYRFEYNKSDHQFNVSICENSISQPRYSCYLRNISQQITEFKAFKYIIIFLSYTGNLTTSTDLQDQVYKFQLTNIQEYEIDKATRLFTIVFGSFLLVTILFIAYILLKNRLMARLALWGVVTFVPSGIYPLSKIELKLKVRQLLRQGFLIEYKYQKKQSGKQQSYTIEQCSFCLQQFERDESIFEIYCRHKYHKTCLSDWIKRERNSQKCPICKRGFTEAELLRFNEGSYSYGFNQEAANVN